MKRWCVTTAVFENKKKATKGCSDATTKKETKNPKSCGVARGNQLFNRFFFSLPCLGLLRTLPSISVHGVIGHIVAPLLVLPAHRRVDTLATP
jgi:hypothetical protein